MSEEKVKELQAFADNFNKKLRESFKLYENKRQKFLKKSVSTINNRINIKNKFATLSLRKNDEKKRCHIKINLIKKAWKPPGGAPDYFEEFKSLKNHYDLNNWEKVNKYFFLNIIEIQQRIILCKRSYEKEKELPQKINFVCRNLYGNYLSEYPNIKLSLTSSCDRLGKLGKKIISYYIKDNDKNEKKMKEKDEYLYNYYHSKPVFDVNPWKYSNHIIKEFSRPPIDKIHSFSSIVRVKPKYEVKPFKRPKIYGDYFDKNVY